MLKALWTRIRNLNKLFIYVVVLPTAVAILYFGIIASPVYISESRFIVYSPSQHISSSGLSSLLSGLSGSSSMTGTYSVHDYIESWDAMMAVNRAYNLKEVYGNSDIDIFGRFGGLFYPSSSYVKLLRYYQSMVTDNLDNTSGITKLKVRAYSAADAQKINALLLQKSEALINQMNDQARENAVSYAQQDVIKAEVRVNQATVALAEYRNEHTVFSPKPQSRLQLKLISQLQEQVISEKAQLAAILQHAPQNPQIPVLRSGIAALVSEVDKEKAKVVGGKGSLASKDPAYVRLSLAEKLATKILEAAVTSLEQAEVEAQKQQLYLEPISRPNLPDAPQEPHRVRDILGVLVLALVVWGVLSILIAGVREHHD